MTFQVPTPTNLSEIRGCVLTYIIQAPHFQSYRRAVTYDFTGDDVLKSIEDALCAQARKVIAKKPPDPGRPARWISYIREARRLLATNQDAARTAFAVGYESPTQFSREFSRRFGFTPSDLLRSAERVAA